MDFSSCGSHAASFCGWSAHPYAEWLARQLTEACGWDEPPRYLIRDGAYGAAFIRRIRANAERTGEGVRRAIRSFPPPSGGENALMLPYDRNPL